MPSSRDEGCKRSSPLALAEVITACWRYAALMPSRVAAFRLAAVELFAVVAAHPVLWVWSAPCRTILWSCCVS